MKYGTIDGQMLRYNLFLGVSKFILIVHSNCGTVFVFKIVLWCIVYIAENTMIAIDLIQIKDRACER